MINLIKTRINHGYQAIKEVRAAVLGPLFRGLPEIAAQSCPEGCHRCLDVCPTAAITLTPVSVDMGKCIFCGDCQVACPESKIRFTPNHKLATTAPEHLLIDASVTAETFAQKAIESQEKIRNIFKRSLKLRQVSAAGCNGCEMELNACSNVNFDMQRFGIEFVASPRHADGVVITGPISQNMAYALEETYRATPEPKILILVGSCAISGGVFANSGALNREFLDKHSVDLYVPGCPTHPLTFINGILAFLDRKK